MTADDATRWRATGTNLGLDIRNLYGEYGQQGSFRFFLGYDELRHNISDTFMTPYNGAGSNNLTLPANWIVPVVPQNSATAVNARAFSSESGLAPGPYTYNAGSKKWTATAPTAANTASVMAIQAADLPAFHNENIYTTRKAIDGGFLVNLSPQFDLQVTGKHEKKEGLKLMSSVSRIPASTTGGPITDVATTLPIQVDDDTNQVNVSLNFHDDKSFFTAAYYGSQYLNGVTSMNWTPWQTGNTVAGAGVVTGHPFATQSLSTAPSNFFNQFSVVGGYNFDPKTKLVVNGSYGRNTQNSSYNSDPSVTSMPVASLDGLVVSENLGAKFTAKPVKDMNFSAGYKYDLRDNRTGVNTYMYADAAEPAVANASFPGVTAQNANANRAYSKRSNLFNLDADYMIARGNAIKAGLDWQNIQRWCNGSWTDCVDAATTKETTGRLEYRANMIEDLSGRISYAYSSRRVSDYNENAFLALVPYANVTPKGGATTSANQYMLANGLTGYGLAAPYAVTTGNTNVFFPNNNALVNSVGYANNNRISELPGMRRYNMADRIRNKVRASSNWQATDQLSLTGGLDFNYDDYNNSAYGLQNAKSWALNLDATYATSENLSVSMYYTYENQASKSAGDAYTANSNTANVNGQTAVVGGCYPTIQTRNNNAKIDPCYQWSMDMTDNVSTLGFGVKQKDLLSGKLELGGDLVMTWARTNVNALSGGAYANNPLAVSGVPANTVPAAYWIPASDLPTVTTNALELRITGKYTIDKASAVRVGYLLMRMKSTDYAYDGMQYGTMATVLPTNQQAPDYLVQSLGAAYIYSF